MLITVTPNPSLDRTVELDKLRRGAVLRVRHAHVEPGGKGADISHALSRTGLGTRAVLPRGGADDPRLAELLAAAGIEPDACVRSTGRCVPTSTSSSRMAWLPRLASLGRPCP